MKTLNEILHTFLPDNPIQKNLLIAVSVGFFLALSLIYFVAGILA